MINYFPHFKKLLLCRKKKCHHVSCPLQTAVNMIINFFDCSLSIHFTEFLMGSEQYDVLLCSIAWSYLTLCDPLDCSAPGSSVHGIPQARILEWVAISYSRGSFSPRDQTQVPLVSCISRWILHLCAIWEVHSPFSFFLSFLYLFLRLCWF